jgi:hypothetical protein
LTEESEYDREKVPEEEEEEEKRSRQGKGHATTRHDAPKKIEEPEHLDQYTYSRPFEEDEEYTAEEAGRPAQLILAREKVERLLRADDEEEAA